MICLRMRAALTELQRVKQKMVGVTGDPSAVGRSRTEQPVSESGRMEARRGRRLCGGTRGAEAEYPRRGLRPGFAPTEENIAILPAHIRDALADAVQEFAELDEETRIGFR